MTKILDWDDDDFFDVENQIKQKKTPQDFDDDSFWENYNFESELNCEKKLISDNGIQFV